MTKITFLVHKKKNKYIIFFDTINIHNPNLITHSCEAGSNIVLTEIITKQKVEKEIVSRIKKGTRL